jgi:type VI secretion system secreted protein VgrG
LLSTGTGALLPHHAAPVHHLNPFQARAAINTHVHLHTLTGLASSRHTARPATISAKPLERPAGTVVTGTPTPFDPIIGAAATRSTYGVTGTGLTVAVIDTGVDYNNPALGGSFGPGSKVIAGYDFASGSADPLATTSQHGTAVAGLIGSSDPNNLGVAPGVNIVALKVTGNDNSASLSSIAQALQWVIDHHSQYNITVVNMSLSDGGNYAQNWFAHDNGVGQQITGLIGQLQSLNIPVVSATGNNFNGQQGEGFTSIVNSVISVTATDTSGHLLPDAQRLGSTVGLGTMTDLAAPGTGFVAPSGDSGYSNVDGTSFAAPLVSGAVVLLQQIYQQRFGTLPTVAQVTGWLEQGADPINDPATGLSIGQLDITKAAALIPSPAPSPPPPTVSVPVTTTSSGTTKGGSAAVTQVSYTPVVSTPPASTTPSATQSTNDSNPTPPPAPLTLPASVQVYVNGQQVSSLGTTSGPSPIASLSPTAYNSFLLSMSAWGAGTGSTDSSPSSSSTSNQVRIWNAPAQSAGGPVSPAGTLTPAGGLMMKLMRTRHRGK